MDFANKQLKKFYISLNVVEAEVKITEEKIIRRKKIYIVYGVDIEGKRDLMDVYLEEENASFWLEKFQSIKSRGVEDVIHLVTKKHKNIEKCAKIVYANINLIETPYDIARQLIKYCPEKGEIRVITRIKNLFLASNKEMFYEEKEEFKELYQEYKLIKLILEKNEEIIEQFYEYEEYERKIYYPYYLQREINNIVKKIGIEGKICSNIEEIRLEFENNINKIEKDKNSNKEDLMKIINKLYEKYGDRMSIYL